MPYSRQMPPDIRELGTWFQDVRTVPTVSALANIPVSEHAAIRAGTSTYDVAPNINEQAASMSADGGGALLFGLGTYLYLTRLIRPPNVSFVGLGPSVTTLDFNSATDIAFAVDLEVDRECCIAAMGPEPTALPALAADVDRHALTVVFASDITALLARGDIIKIHNPTPYSGSWHRANYYAGEMLPIMEIDPDGVTVYLARPTYEAYAAADVNMYKLNLVRGTISNMTIVGKTKASGTDPMVLYIKHGTGLLTQNLELTGSNFLHVAVSQCYDWQCGAQVRYYTVPGGTNYGVSINNSCNGVMLPETIMATGRHPLTLGGADELGVFCRNIDIYGFYEGRAGGSVGAVGLHGNCEYIYFKDTTLINGITLSGNHIYGSMYIQTGLNPIAIGGSELIGMDVDLHATIDVMADPVSGSGSNVGVINLNLQPDLTEGGTMRLSGTMNMGGHSGQPMFIYHNGAEGDIGLDIHDFKITNVDPASPGSLCIIRAGAGSKWNTIEWNDCSLDAAEIRCDGTGARLTRFENVRSLDANGGAIQVFTNDLVQTVYQTREEVGGVFAPLVLSYDDETGAEIVETSQCTLANANDSVYFGYSMPYSQVEIEMTTNFNTNTATMTWEYCDSFTWNPVTEEWDKTWAALSGVTDTTISGGAPLAQDGIVSFTIPGGWVKARIGADNRGGTRVYWIRGRTSAALTQVQLGVDPVSGVASTVTTPQPVTEEHMEALNCTAVGGRAAGIHFDGVSQSFSTARISNCDLHNNGESPTAASPDKTSLYVRNFLEVIHTHNIYGDTRAPLIIGPDTFSQTSLFYAQDITRLRGKGNTNVNPTGLTAISLTNVTYGLETHVSGKYETTYGTVAPTTGTWIVGDTCINTNPTTAGMIDRWRCTVAGTPGTWTALANGSGTTWASITGTPTTLAGYGITDAVALAGAQTVAGVKTFSSAPVFSTMTLGSVLFAGTAGALTQDNASLFYDDTNNKLGIGINSALTGKVHVVHNVTGVYTAHRVLQFAGDIADTSGTPNTASIAGVYGIMRFAAANTSNNTHADGMSGLVADVRTITGATGTISNMQGLLVAALQNAGNTVLTAAYGVRVNAVTNAGSGSITRYAGVAVNQQTVATNNTLVLLGTVTAPSGNYGIYNSSTYQNHLAGKTGIGVVTPLAVLHLAAGTTAANTAPLKITSGTSMTTPEAGVVEYNGRFSVTESDTTRRYVVQGDGVAKVTAGAPFTNDGHIVITVNGVAYKVMTTA